MRKSMGANKINSRINLELLDSPFENKIKVESIL